MNLVVDDANLGTPESTWLAAFEAVSVPIWSWGAVERIVVVAPHPDDEILALGGSLARLAKAGARIDVVAVTRGEASHPRSSHVTPAALADLRTRERAEALAKLGIENVRIVELGRRDGGVVDDDALVERMAKVLVNASVCVAPWTNDGHPDHDAAGRAAAKAAARAHVPLLEYVVWGWHWATPSRSDFPWARLRRIPLAPEERNAKRSAIAAYRTQVAPLGVDEPDVILPPHVLARFERPFEAVLA